MGIVSGSNSSSSYFAGVSVSVSGNTSNSKTATFTVIPYLKRSAAVKRYQHTWKVRYYQDGVLKATETLNLPDNTSESGVTSRGYLNMVANKWYQWGPSKTFTVDKINAKRVGFTITLECVDTVPWNDLTVVNYNPAHQYTDLVAYYIDPTYPTGLSASFDEDTRIISYTWATAHCDYVQLYRSLYDENDSLIKEGYVNVSGRTNNKLYNTDLPIKETLTEDVAKVIYKVYNVSVSGHYKWTLGLPVTIDTYSKVLIKVNGNWKKAVPWVKINGVWKKVTKTYVKVGSNWKRTIS